MTGIIGALLNNTRASFPPAPKFTEKSISNQAGKVSDELQSTSDKNGL
jgi:hypothetical protein